MRLNRELQMTVLQAATDSFPRPLRLDYIRKLIEQFGKAEADGNLLYLEMHGLVDLKFRPQTFDDNESTILIHQITPTEKAFDFLADDGGLSAILGVVTVKLHADTVRDLIESKIMASDLPQAEKQSLLDSLKSLPDEALKHLITKLIDSAFENWPAVLLLLGKFFAP